MPKSVNPPHGQKGGFCKISITVPAVLVRKLTDRAVKRKILKQPNATVSAVAREALEAGLAR